MSMQSVNSSGGKLARISCVVSLVNQGECVDLRLDDAAPVRGTSDPGQPGGTCGLEAQRCRPSEGDLDIPQNLR